MDDGIIAEILDCPFANGSQNVFIDDVINFIIFPGKFIRFIFSMHFLFVLTLPVHLFIRVRIV